MMRSRKPTRSHRHASGHISHLLRDSTAVGTGGGLPGIYWAGRDRPHAWPVGDEGRMREWQTGQGVGHAVVCAGMAADMGSLAFAHSESKPTPTMA